MTCLAAILAALAVLPSDRMAMADRLFDRGEWKRARTEYEALSGAEGIARDEVLFRLGECARLLGDGEAARKAFAELLDRHPMSRRAPRARLMKALAAPEKDKAAELKALDSDRTDAKTRAAALYHYGFMAGDRDALERCIKLDPDGKYAAYAKFRHAALSADDKDPAVRRAAVRELVELHHGGNPELGREAIYFAAVRSYSDGRYGEASTLFRRYLKLYPGDAREGEARNMAAWSDYLSGRYGDAAALCGEGRTDDTAYLLAACAYGAGDIAKAKERMERYLEDYPQGKYRKAVELPLARMAFEAAGESGNAVAALEAAKRCAALSGNARDSVRVAWALERAGRETEAAATYAAVAEAFPGTEESSEALYRKAMIDMRGGRWSAAELALGESLASGKDRKRRAEALYWRGMAAERIGHGAEGAGFLREALKAGLPLDESREARLALADADFKAGRAAAAKAEYAKLVREGATDRMSASRMRSVGRFLLECPEEPQAVEEALACAKALAERGDAPEWRQAAFALMGEAQEAAGESTAALASYRRAMAERVRTEESAKTSLRLGILLSRAGERDEADGVLKEAVALNAKDAQARAEAYLWLARNSEASGDLRGACAYATVLSTLFEGTEAAETARKILEAHPEEAK